MVALNNGGPLRGAWIRLFSDALSFRRLPMPRKGFFHAHYRHRGMRGRGARPGDIAPLRREGEEMPDRGPVGEGGACQGEQAGPKMPILRIQAPQRRHQGRRRPILRLPIVREEELGLDRHVPVILQARRGRHQEGHNADLHGLPRLGHSRYRRRQHQNGPVLGRQMP